jgi:hypothetical protein
MFHGGIMGCQISDRRLIRTPPPDWEVQMCTCEVAPLQQVGFCTVFVDNICCPSEAAARPAELKPLLPFTGPNAHGELWTKFGVRLGLLPHLYLWLEILSAIQFSIHICMLHLCTYPPICVQCP